MLTRVFWVGLAAVTAAGSALAQAPDPQQRQLEESFRRVLANPGDAALNADYAQRLIDAGRYESAVATLERVLIADPTQVQVRVELGALYFRLGSYETARAYFQRALADPSLPAELRPRVQQYLADITERLSPHKFDGFVSAGARWDSNANTGPDPINLRANGFPFTRVPAQRPQSDFSFFGVGRVQHAYDLETQNDMQIVSTLLGYGNAFSKFSRQDLLLGEVTTGLRFKPAPTGLPDLLIRPHVIGNTVALNSARYLSTYGFGLDVTYSWSDRLVSELTLEFRRPEYATIARLGDVQNQSGDEKVAKLRTAYEINLGSLVIADLVYRSAATRRGYYDYTQWQATLTYSFSYDAPAKLTEQAWNVAPFVSYYSRGYGGPDIFTDPRRTRSDDNVRVGFTHTIPFAGSWSTYQQVEHTWSESNIPNFQYQDTAVVVGLSRRF